MTTHAADLRRLTNEALDMTNPLVSEVATAVRNAAIEETMRGGHRLVNPIPASVDRETAEAAYSMLAQPPYSLSVTSEPNSTAEPRRIVSW